MVRAPCCDKVGLKKGPWTPDEDQILISFIQNHGHSNWRALPKQAGLLRCGKSCRLRWINYLKPDIKRGHFTKEEEDTIIQLHEMMGNRWSTIASKLPGRTDNEIKNVWHTHLKKRLPKYQTQKPQSKKSNSKHKEANNIVKSSKSTINGNNFSDTSGRLSSEHVPTSSQQSYTSEEFSTNSEITSSAVPNNMSIVKNEHYKLDSQQFDIDYFPIIDETFWSCQDGLSNDNDTSFFLENVVHDIQLQSPISTGDTSDVSNNFALVYPEKNVDSMDYWFDVFIKAGGETELPDF